jgi:hypothetical protein
MAGRRTPYKKTEYVILDDGLSMSETARLKSLIAHNHSVWLGVPEALRAFNAHELLTLEATLRHYPWRAGTFDMNMQVERGDTVLVVGLCNSNLWKFQKVRDYPGCIGVFQCLQGGWFHNVMILVRYVPDGVNVFDVSFSPIEIIDVLEPWVTHKTVVSSALNGEIKCEFDADLTAISCSDLVDRVLDELKMPAHHGHKLVHADRVILRFKGTVASKFRIAIARFPSRRVKLVEPCGEQSTPQRKKRRISKGPQAPESSQSRGTLPIDMDAVNVSACVRAKLTKGFDAYAV